MTGIAVDMGNTTTSIALFDKEGIGLDVRLPTSRFAGGEDVAGIVIEALVGAGDMEMSAEGSVISSVVPARLPALREGLGRLCGGDPVVVGPGIDLGIEIGYERPEELGPDRIAAAVAGFAEAGGAVIVVDLGTATTFNAVTGGGLFLGGAIAPGVVTGAEAIARGGARLFGTDLLFPDRVIGGSTDHSLRSGVLWGAVSMVDGMIDRIRNEMGGAEVIATGGLAPIVGPRSERIDRIDPLLTLKGLTRLFYRNR